MITNMKTFNFENFTGTINLHRFFSTSSALNYPRDNDQDTLINKIDLLEQDFNEVDDELENLKKDIVEEEEMYEEDGEATELSKLIEDSVSRKDHVVGEFEQAGDHALFSNQDVREDKVLTLEKIKQSAEEDIKTLKEIKSNLEDSNDHQSTASILIEKLQEQKSEASKLLEEWTENDLNYIRPSNSQASQSNEPQESFPQDSSDVHQTEFDSSDYYDD